jgi:putative membrane protein
MIRNYADHASNERTFLAWVRTAVAIVGFGIAVARLGSATVSAWTETGLVVSGGVVIVFAYLRMRSLRKRINHSDELDDGSERADGLLVAMVLALFATMVLFVIHAG